MKTNKILFLIIMCLNLQAFVFAQHQQPAALVSDKGWWVVESNIHIPKQYTVYFYNNDGILVYKERIEGLRLNIARPKIKLHLKEVLEASVVAWEKQHRARENQALVITRLRKKE